MQTLTLKAPAKVNLYLHVLNKRPDGFHNVETIFEKIELGDKIVLTRCPQGIKLSCAPKGLPCDKRNLAYQAADLLLRKTRCSDGVQIKIGKKIPIAAGLGGGSSDAASVLWGLNQLLHLGLSRNALLQLAEQLGADVPFFLLRNVRAIGRGKGERLTPLRLRKKNWYVLALPKGLLVSTRQMYQHPRLTLTKHRSNVKIVLRALQKGDLTSVNKYSYNSFERILQKKYKVLQQIKKALKSSGAQATLVSGSGPCIFGMAKTRKEAMEISNRLKAQDKSWQIIVTSTFQMKPRLMERTK